MSVAGTRCPACHATRIKPAFGSSGSFLRCRECGTVFDAAPPTPEEINELYTGKEYFVRDEASSQDDDTLWGYADDYLADREFIATKFDRVLEHLERYAGPGRLLDVGAGPGFLVEAANKRGWQATGVDLNEWAANYAREELGLDVRTGPLADQGFEDDSFDAITMMDVVEHVPDPDEIIAEAARLVRPQGALALLTPDAGAVMSRLLGRRWPEVRRPGEHVVLFSVQGLSATLARHGFAASGWHTIGKEAPIATILADIAPAAPRWTDKLRESFSERPASQRIIDVDPRTKFVLYARRLPTGGRPPAHRPARVPKKPEEMANFESAILDELQSLADAPRLCQWLYDTYAELVPGAKILEVGAGIGTFTQRMLDGGAEHVVAMEPETSCADALERAFEGEPRVEVTRDGLPGAPALVGREGTFDLVVCQNVLEHIADDRGALESMAEALRPGGHLSLLVPAQPGLYGGLDDAYGHWRRYALDEVRELVSSAGFEVESVHGHNALGVAGWWTKNRRPGARIGSTSLRAYELLVAAWRPLEDKVGSDFGLSLVCTARKPA